MTSSHPRSREHIRFVERLIALAEAYGCDELDALRADLDVAVRIEFLTFQRTVRSAEERWRRRLERGAAEAKQ